MSKSIFGDVPLTDAERRFLRAAHTGDVQDLVTVLEENGHLSINCVDYLGRSALHLAVLEEHHAVLVYLLDRWVNPKINRQTHHLVAQEEQQELLAYLLARGRSNR